MNELEKEADNLLTAGADVANSLSSNPALYSIAISMKRIADALNSPNDHGEVGSAALTLAISRGLR